MIDKMTDRARGVMLGLACGDALGAQVEFRVRGSFKTPRDMRAGGPHRLEAGQWTDDTAMALALADHLVADVRTSREEIRDLMGRWLRWLDNGDYSCTGTCFDVGGRTLSALRHWDRTGETLSVRARRPYPDGNGAVMRVAPVALRWLRDQDMCESTARWQARLTHGRIAASAAVVVAETIRRLVAGESWMTVLGEAQHSEHYVGAGARCVESLRRGDVESGGHSVDTLETSLWCLLYADTAEEAIVSAVALGHDTDTTAAVTGAIAGARWGASALPERWTEKVAWRERLENAADRLVAAHRGESSVCQICNHG